MELIREWPHGDCARRPASTGESRLPCPLGIPADLAHTQQPVQARETLDTKYLCATLDRERLAHTHRTQHSEH